MVRELAHWFVGGMHGARELVGALDFSRMERAHEQSTAGPAADKRRYASDIVWRVPSRTARPAARTGPSCSWC